MAPTTCNPGTLGPAFVDAARRYWLSVLPLTCREARTWCQRASEIPNPTLRKLALDAQRTKRQNLEGVTAFAAFVPPARQAQVVRALIAYQVTFDYIDTIAEQSDTDPIANGRQLNQALHTSLEPGAPHLDYYAYHDHCEDGGYLNQLVETCRTALGTFPSHRAVADPARRAAARVVRYQSLNHGDGNGSYDAFAAWARAETTPSTGLRWWETGAAAGSPLPVLALIAAAANPNVRPDDAAAIEAVYFPWIASLSTLLDSLIDHQEDLDDGQRNLIDYYSSPQEAAARLQLIATQALHRARTFAGGHHALILAAMVSFFHCSRPGASSDIHLATQGILDAMGHLAMPSTLMLQVRARAARLAKATKRGVSHPAETTYTINRGLSRDD